MFTNPGNSLCFRGFSLLRKHCGMSWNGVKKNPKNIVFRRGEGHGELSQREILPDISPVMEEYMKFLQKMKKTEQKIYAMEQTKIHERIEEKKREAAQQHSLQLSRNSRYFAWYRILVLVKYNQALPENGRRLVLRQREWTLWLHRNLCEGKSGKGGQTYERLWNALHRFDDTWYCRYDLNSIYQSYEKVTAPRPKDCGYFS